jgi:hypothetical protein
VLLKQKKSHPPPPPQGIANCVILDEMFIFTVFVLSKGFKLINSFAVLGDQKLTDNNYMQLTVCRET